MSAGAPWWKVSALWLARVATGALFILSGWAKTVDPRGFVYKIQEYLAVWGIDGLLPRELVIIGAITLSIIELILGILLLTGCLRRTAAIGGLCLMAFMLPLTAYIAVADPVADCGCFGDMMVVDNDVTFYKNVIATALLVICLVWRRAAQPLYRPGLQWLVVALTAVYGIVIATIGWQLQPVVDFRPFAPGTPLARPDVAQDNIKYVYERGGSRQEFALDALPDSTWTFVGQATGQDAPAVLSLFDGDDEIDQDALADMTADSLVILAVTEPGIHNLTRSRLANDLYAYCRSQGIAMAGAVALEGDALEQWREMAVPAYPVYSSDDTALKQLVRGAIGLVYVQHDTIRWKRNFTSLSPDFLSRPQPLAAMRRVDDGSLAAVTATCYCTAMALLWLLSALTKLRLRPRRRTKPTRS